MIDSTVGLKENPNVSFVGGPNVQWTEICVFLRKGILSLKVVSEIMIKFIPRRCFVYNQTSNLYMHAEYSVAFFYLSTHD